MGLGIPAILLTCLLGLAAFTDAGRLTARVPTVGGVWVGCPPSSAAVGCPPYWTHFEGSCYRLFGEPATWTGARKQCRSLGSELVSVQSNGENSFVYDLWRSGTQTESVGSGFWMDLNDRKEEGRFALSDGTVDDFTKWHGNEPNNKNNEDCVHFLYRGEQSDSKKTWNDLPCDRKLAYVCELDSGLLVDPSLVV